MSKSNKGINLSLNSEYKSWLKDLKQKVLSTQLKAAVQVNTTLLAFYWELGEDIVRRQAEANWGDGLLKQLSKDLMTEFPEMKGFSRRNLELIRQWYLFWNQTPEIAQQAVAQFRQQLVAQKGQQPVGRLLYTSIAALPARSTIIPGYPPVIPAKAGVHRGFTNA